jgi:hypothetical protein
MGTIHPIVRLIAETSHLWETDKARAFNRAMLIARRLIAAGYVAGIDDNIAGQALLDPSDLSKGRHFRLPPEDMPVQGSPPAA